MAAPSFLSYSLRVSILVEIAEKAHVSVEGVLRVLTKEPVSDAIKERVLAVLDDLDPEQNRVLQRFALAALHDVLPRPGDSVDPVGDEPAEARALLPPGPEPAPQLPVVAPDTAHLVQLSSVLEELAGAVRDLRSETDTERRERVDDLAVLIELISTGWQGLDRRLGRLERQLGRLETGRAQPAQVLQRPHLPVQPQPSVTAPLPEPEPEPEPSEGPEPAVVEQSVRAKRDRLPLVAAVALVGLVVGTLAVLQLVAGEQEVAGISTRGSDFLETVADEPAATEPAPPTTEAAGTTAPARTAPAGTTEPATPPTTSAVLGTDTTRPSPAPPAETTPTRTQAPDRQPAASATTTAAAAPAGFRPTRDWAWAPVEGADYYSVQFLRADGILYRTTTEETRLTLPDSVVFRPGSYRWVVRPGFGSLGAKRLGAPVVDSPFTVQ
jgi:Bacterial regulatory proteins, lacI family